jgi:RNA polymerase sigma-70 factor, ECF subfamily
MAVNRAPVTTAGGHRVVEGVSSRPQPRAGAAPPSELEALYEAEVDYVWASLQHMGTPAADLEDLTHDVFVKAFHGFDRYDRARPLKPWLFAIALRVALNYRRQARHHREVPGLPTEDAADAAPGAERLVGAAEQRDLVLEALEDLSWERRALVVMYYFQEHSVAEIAEVFPAPHNTIYSRLRLALQDLRAAVARRQGGVS